MANAARSAPVSATAPSKLQQNLAAQIAALIRARGYAIGYHLVEADLCSHLSVSRTPIRAALALLAQDGIVEYRPNRGFAVASIPKAVDEPPPAGETDEEENQLFIAIAQAHLNGRLPSTCTQQELLRLFDARLPIVVRVLQQLAALGLVERKPGNGWSFLPSIDSTQTQKESYQFRIVIEPAILLQKEFRATPEWVEDMRDRHEQFHKRRWRDTLAIEFYEMNAEFHLGLAEASGNRYFIQAMEQQNKLRRFLNYNWDFGIERVHESIREHLDLLRAIESGDQELAAVLMRGHLMRASDTPTLTS
ncbi:GntR family transcriptional regulator [Sphingosinicella xenopeptidilytica]|uniref:GntR family transcriptional regulator n=1 Tax=Sphingosinicella xenopeptidilytica TaxID=364098 RepID=A0ABW3C5W1_SPHXN